MVLGGYGIRESEMPPEELARVRAHEERMRRQWIKRTRRIEKEIGRDEVPDDVALDAAIWRLTEAEEKIELLENFQRGATMALWGDESNKPTARQLATLSKVARVLVRFLRPEELAEDVLLCWAPRGLGVEIAVAQEALKAAATGELRRLTGSWRS
jgi:hypothetical protein